MASSSGNSSGSGTTRPGSDEDPRVLMDQRKRRRMESNRESARRSRMRKQKHVDDLTAQIDQLRNENGRILTSVSVTTQQFMNVEAENAVLRAQMTELSHRLDSLNEILRYMNTANNGVVSEAEYYNDYNYNDGFVNNSWNLMYMNQQPILANDDMFQF